MKSGKRRSLQLVVITGIIMAAVALRAELQPWVQHLPAGPLISVFFRSVPMPGGAIDIRRPPKETIPALTAKIAAAPADASLYRLRASEEELALDFTAAESDWRKFAQLSPDHAAANLELADYFHRRIQPNEEMQALRRVAESAGDPLVAPEEQRPWKAFLRMLAVADDQDLPTAVTTATYRAWVVRYPKEPAVRKKYIDYLIDQQQYTTADAQIAAYERVLPSDNVYPTQARANLALARGNFDAANKIYDESFQPLWPPDLDKSYFDLLDQRGRLRDFLGRARTALQTNPTDLNATARLFHYHMFENNAAAARRTLIELRLAKEARHQPWTSDELLTVAQLFHRVQDINETARCYYALYSLPGAPATDTEQALAGITDLLFTNAGSGPRFASGDLSFYRDIASVDTSPGFLNGILSLLLNSTWPRQAYSVEDQASVAYFQRARAAELVAVFDQRFPRSTRRAGLHASLIRTYATYGDDNAILTAGRAFLAAFPTAVERKSVALLMADAYARANKTTEEFAIYDRLLHELATEAHNVPLGGSEKTRSSEYASVLDRYLSRLAALNRRMDALRVYRREIDRNPNDPGLYERLAAFLEQNGLGQDTEAIYRRAIAKFNDKGWYDKLARWYLRQKQSSAFESLTREVTAVFSGTQLERYFAGVVATSSFDPVLYRQLNVYAHERFPEDLVFVHNLLNAYGTTITRDEAASDRLLRQYWFYEPELRNRLFERFYSEGKLYAEISALRAQNPEIAAGRAQQLTASNPAAAQFTAEAEAWLCHFEASAPEMRSLADAFPGNAAYTTRASLIYRSLAAYDPADTEISASIAEAAYRANPRNRQILETVGDIYADGGRFDRARTVWNRIPHIEPGNSAGYLEAATVFWDYYLYSDALRIIRQGRRDFNDPALFAFEAGAIYENERDFTRAVNQYVAGALDGNQDSRERLLRLAKREGLSEIVDRATAATLTTADQHLDALTLRAEVLVEQERKQDLERLLLSEATNAKSASELAAIGELGTRYAIDSVQARALESHGALTTDPVEKMRLRIELAKLYERTHNAARASSVMDDLYRDNPLILGVVRATVDFHVRNKEPEQAVTTLLDASSHARPDLANQFKLEAANIATGAGRFDRARTLLTSLLANDPYHPEYLAAMAETYSKSGDDRGLRTYQLATIEALKKSGLPAQERIDRIAALRRSLIPALTRLGDFPGAVDQYIEVLNRYPEDDGVARDALLYAAAHNRTAQLLGYYKKTIADAPRDYRWPIVLGRLETYAEDYPAAIAAYDLAMKDRPDRADVVQAREQLEERLMRFDDAIKSCSRLYELTYRNPEWMKKVAELDARLRRSNDAIAALRTAIIGAGKETADNDFTIASQLESWNLVSQALTFAEHGSQLAGEDLDDGGRLVYVKILTRAHHFEPVLNMILASEKPENLISEVGNIVDAYYTPEEKAALEKTLNARRAARADVTEQVFIALAAAAKLVNLEVKLQLEVMSQPESQLNQRLIQLETQRTNFEELGRALESYAAVPRHAALAPVALTEAANAYNAQGDTTAELRVLRLLRDREALNGNLLERYLKIVVKDHPEELLALIRAKTSDDIRNYAVQFAIASDSEPLALRAIEARGAAMPAVWTNSYAALSGLYHADASQQINTAFTAALDTRTIGERIAAPIKRDDQLAGRVWFYYGQRYGEYLKLTKRPGAPDYLPALLEEAPGNPDAYVALGDYYAEADEVPQATTEFNYSLQLDADRADAQDHIARMLWSHNRRTEAIAHWRSALAALLRTEVRGGRVPETFWNWASETMGDIGRAHAMADLRGDIGHLLTDYMSRNATYRSLELLQAAFNASRESGVDPDWIISMAERGPDALQALAELANIPNLTPAQRIRIERARIALEQHDPAFGSLANEKLKVVDLLLDAGDLQAARTDWNQLPQETRDYGELAQQIHLRLAASDGTLAQLLESWRAVENISDSALKEAATLLRKDGNKEAALSILDFMYRRVLGQGNLSMANFLGLAEVLLERDDVPGALAQLHRMVLVTADPFDTFLPAADVLGRYGKNPEAAEFVRARVKAVPWDAAAKLRLVRLGPSPDRIPVLTDIASNPYITYALRADSARLIAPQMIPSLGGTELGLLSGSRILPEDASKPYYVYARMAAAEDMSDPAARLALLRQALAIEPGNGDIEVAAVRAALDARRDALSTALFKGVSTARSETYNQPEQLNPRQYQVYAKSNRLRDVKLSDVELASLAARVAEAAERLDDLVLAQQTLKTAIELTTGPQRPPLEARLKSIEAEQTRRAQNAAREPLVKNVVEQSKVVRPRIVRSAQ